MSTSVRMAELLRLLIIAARAQDDGGDQGDDESGGDDGDDGDDGGDDDGGDEGDDQGGDDPAEAPPGYFDENGNFWGQSVVSLSQIMGDVEAQKNNDTSDTPWRDAMGGAGDYGSVGGGNAGARSVDPANFDPFTQGVLAGVGAQGVQSSLVRSWYSNAVQSLEADESLARTLIKQYARLVDSPIGSAWVNAARSDLGPSASGVALDSFYFSDIVGGSANIADPGYTAAGAKAGVVGGVMLLGAIGYGVWQTATSANPLQTGVSEASTLAGSMGLGYVGGSIGAVAADLIGVEALAVVGLGLVAPEVIAAGLALAGTVYLANVGANWGREFGGQIYDLIGNQ